MSLYALTTSLVQRIKAVPWGFKITDQNGDKKDPGLQAFADALVAGLSNQGSIPLPSPLTFTAPEGGGPSMIINRFVPVVGDNSGGDSFNVNLNTGVIRFIDQNANIVDVPGDNPNITLIGGTSISTGGTGASGSVQVVSDVSANLSIAVSVSGCNVTCTPTLTLTLTKITLQFLNGLFEGAG